jgi:acyl carrier protein
LKNSITDDKILAEIIACSAAALRIDAAKIKAESRFFLDLGAESIDILDIRFRVEQAFGFKIDQDALMQSLGEGLSALQIQEKLTVASLVAYIRERLSQQN